jgi:hypothetical protein
MFRHRGHATARSGSISQAAECTLGIWNRLVRFVDDARIALDNNHREDDSQHGRRPQE